MPKFNTFREYNTHQKVPSILILFGKPYLWQFVDICKNKIDNTAYFIENKITSHKKFLQLLNWNSEGRKYSLENQETLKL